MGVQRILSVNGPVTINIMLHFDDEFDGDGQGDDMCKQSLTPTTVPT